MLTFLITGWSLWISFLLCFAGGQITSWVPVMRLKPNHTVVRCKSYQWAQIYKKLKGNCRIGWLFLCKLCPHLTLSFLYRCKCIFKLIQMDQCYSDLEMQPLLQDAKPLMKLWVSDCICWNPFLCHSAHWILIWLQNVVNKGLLLVKLLAVASRVWHVVTVVDKSPVALWGRLRRKSLLPLNTLSCETPRTSEDHLVLLFDPFVKCGRPSRCRAGRRWDFQFIEGRSRRLPKGWTPLSGEPI